MRKPIYILPKTIEAVTTLDESHIRPYLDSIKSYNNPKARETLGEGNQRVSAQNELFAGSSSFINPFLLHMDSKNQGLFPDKSRPATRPDLETALTQDPQFLNGLYADFGIAIWKELETYEPNKLLHQTLVEQFKQRDISLGTGKLIPFSALSKPREDSNSAYGLVFDLNDSATKEDILDLDSFKWDFTKGKGLARAFRYYRNWNCDYDNLAYSNSNGRVVGVVEVATENLSLGFSEEELKNAFATAGIPGNYELVKQHLQDI